MNVFIMVLVFVSLIIFAGFASAYIHEEIEDVKYQNKPKLIFIWIVLTTIMLGDVYYGYSFILKHYNNNHQIRVDVENYTD